MYNHGGLQGGHEVAVRSDSVPLMKGEDIEAVYQEIAFMCPFSTSGRCKAGIYPLCKVKSNQFK